MSVSVCIYIFFCSLVLGKNYLFVQWITSFLLFSGNSLLSLLSFCSYHRGHDMLLGGEHVMG